MDFFKITLYLYRDTGLTVTVGFMTLIAARQPASFSILTVRMSTITQRFDISLKPVYFPQNVVFCSLCILLFLEPVPKRPLRHNDNEERQGTCLLLMTDG